jgi:uncharacterized membrane protein
LDSYITITVLFLIPYDAIGCVARLEILSSTHRDIPMTSALFAVLASICYGAGDFFGGVATRRADLLFVILVNQIAALGALLLAAYLLNPFQLPSQDLVLGAVAGLSTAIAIPMLYKSLAIGPMSIVAPVTALVSILFPVAYGLLILGEAPGWLTLTGFAVGGCAVFLLGGGARITEIFRPATGIPPGALRGFAYALGAGACIAIFYVLIKHCSPESGLWPLVVARTVAMTAIAALAGLRHRTRPVVKPALGPVIFIVLAGALDGAGNAFYLLATHGGALSVVSTIASLYPATTILLARYVLGERISLPQAIGVCTALAAIVAIVSSLPASG